MLRLFILGMMALSAAVSTQQDARPVRVAAVTGFAIPESAKFDPDRDQYFISNVNVHATAPDNNGFISLMSADGAMVQREFIAGGRDGVTLHAPKGMAFRGSMLWVTDVTSVRSFDRRSGKPGAAIDLAPHGAVFLNDITAAPDGTLYVSDTSLIFEDGGKVRRGGTDRVFRIANDGTAAVAIADAKLEAPNGVYWDRAQGRLLIASIGGKNVYAWTPAAGLSLIASGPGGYDGIERLDDGTFLISSQDLPGVLALSDGKLTPLITGVSDTGDIGLDTKRRRIAIPTLERHVVELWQLP